MSSFGVVNGTFEGWKTQPNDGKKISMAKGVTTLMFIGYNFETSLK